MKPWNSEVVVHGSAAPSFFRSRLLVVLVAALGLAGCPPDGDEESPPIVLQPPLKVVRIRWCLVDDGRTFPVPQPIFGPAKSLLQNPGAPQFRFFGGIRAAGLNTKNLIFAPAGIFFVPAGPPVTINDPDPNLPPFREGGEVGDVVDPLVGDRFRELSPNPPPNSLAARGLGMGQWLRVRQSCLGALGPAGAGVLVEILIRRWVWGVDNDGDGRFDEDTARDGVNDDGFVNFLGLDGEDPIDQSSLLGASPVPPCSFVPPALAKTPTVADPTRFAGIPPPGFVNFGETLAHENGHALCLTHALAPPGGLMTPVRPPFGQQALAGAEIALLLAQAQHLGGTVDRRLDGIPIPRTGPVGRQGFDEVGDASQEWVDIFGTVIATREDGSLGLLLEVAGLLPQDLGEARYRWAVDFDNDPKTGAPVPGLAGTPFHGADLRLEVRVSVSGGEPRLEPNVLRAVQGEWVPAEARLTDLRLAAEMLTRPPDPDFPTNHLLFAVLPTESFPTPLADGYRVLAQTFAGEKLQDEAPPVIGSTVVPAPGPLLSLDPVSAYPGDRVKVEGRGFAPLAPVGLFLGSDFVDSTQTDAHGAFSLLLEAPVPTPSNSSPLGGGRSVSPLLAVDSNEQGDAMPLTLLSRAHD